MRLTYQGKLYDASSLSLTLFNCRLDNGSCAGKHPLPLSSMLVSCVVDGYSSDQPEIVAQLFMFDLPLDWNNHIED